MRLARSQKTHGGCKMGARELVAAYRLHSAQCTEIAQRSRDPEIKLTLLTMAQAWLTLADQAIKNSETVLVYETPIPKRS
jgi:putative IMPACT (imprinted ancient) family translation regulator